MFSHKCREGRFACIEIDPSKLEVRQGGKIRVFVSSHVKSKDPNARTTQILIDAPETAEILKKPRNAIDAQRWPGRGVGENDLKTEVAQESENIDGEVIEVVAEAG